MFNSKKKKNKIKEREREKERKEKKTVLNRYLILNKNYTLVINVTQPLILSNISHEQI